MPVSAIRLSAPLQAALDEVLKHPDNPARFRSEAIRYILYSWLIEHGFLDASFRGELDETIIRHYAPGGMQADDRDMLEEVEASPERTPDM